jgi:hypothetical protein
MPSQNKIPLAPAFVWTPQPILIWVAVKPHNALQAHVLDQLRARLERNGCIFVDRPDQETPLGSIPDLGIVFGQDREQEFSPFEYMGQLPKPRGIMMVINTVEQIPHGTLFDLAREQLVRKSGHIGVLFEGRIDGAHVSRALWGSMAGNNRLLNTDEPTLFDSVALRMQAHANAEAVNSHDGDNHLDVTWEAWAASSIHQDFATAGRRLGDAGLIEDEVNLWVYASSDQGRNVLRFLNRAALGEGMRSQLDLDLGIMGVTTSGGKKVTLSPDPLEGYVVPVNQLTGSGYIGAIPKGCPISYVTPSVETHENGMVYLASALVGAGIVHDFDSFYAYVNDRLATDGRVDILPKGLRPRVTVIEHFHRQPKAGTIKEPGRVEVVFPDPRRFPESDFPCGTRDAEKQLLSGAFNSEFFLDSAPLGNRTIIVVLPGHGIVALYDGPHAALNDFLVNGMVWEEIVRI